jgi:uncharacterized protein YfaT (DUF1175 family)
MRVERDLVDVEEMEMFEKDLLPNVNPTNSQRRVLHRVIHKRLRQYPLPLWVVVACDGFWDVCASFLTFLFSIILFC